MSIIQFPIKTVRQKRLAQALASIEESLAIQKEAVELFRKTNKELGKEMANLRDNMKKFQNAMGNINVRPLRKHSLRLATIMANAEKA